MDELENDALSLLLVLDDNLFPQFLEWAGASGWADLVLFILEADTLRFRISDEFVLPKDKISFQQSFHLIWKNNNGCFNRIIPRDRVESLKRLTESQIPFNAVFSQICDMVWSEMIKRGRHIASSSMWPSIRRCIVDHAPLSMDEVLDDMTYRKYLERFLQGNPSDLACLQCWISTRRILSQVEGYVRSVASIAASAAEDDSKSSFMRRWRTSSTAVKSANKALQVGSGSISSVNNANSNNGVGHDSHSQFPQDKEFSDPFEAFKLLLDGTRSLQKQFFPVLPHAGNSSSAANYVNILSSSSNSNNNSANRSSAVKQSKRIGDMDDQRTSGYLQQGNRDRGDSQDSDGDSVSYSSTTITMSATSTGGSNKPTNRNCSGLSDSLRMELAATLSLNSSVRTRNIETVDQAFAFACANSLDRLLRALERETYAYISKVYKIFEGSTDYATMVATKRAHHAPQIASYIERLEFLSDRVRHEKHVHWTDANSAGKMYLFYEQAGGVDTDDEEGDSSDADSETSGEVVTYLEGGTGSMSSLLAVGNKDTNIMRNLLAAKISNIHNLSGDAHSLRKDNRFNTSSSGWQFSQAESFMIRKQPVGEEQQARSHTSNAFNPDIVAVSLEFYVPESEPISPSNINNVTSHMRVWVGGSNYKPKVIKNTVQSLGSEGKSKAPPNTPIDSRNRGERESTVSPAQKTATGLAIHMEECEEEGEDENSDSEDNSDAGEDEGGDVIEETTTDGGDIDFDALLSKTSSKRLDLSAVTQPAALSTLKKKSSFLRKRNVSRGNQLDLQALDLEALDKNFNRHLYQSGAVHSTAPNHLSLKQLVSSLVLGLVKAHDTSCVGDSDRFDFQSEESVSFVVDSRGLQNLNNLIFSNKVAKQSVSEFKASFTGISSGGKKAYLERPYNNIATTSEGSMLYNVSICVKTSIVGPSELAVAHKRLHGAEYSIGSLSSKSGTPHAKRASGGASNSSPFSGGGVACTSLFNINEEESSDGGSSGADNSKLSAATLKNRADQRISGRASLASNLPRYKTKVNVGMCYSPINPRHCMMSLLKNISLQVFYQSLLHPVPVPAASKPNSSQNSPIRDVSGLKLHNQVNSLVSSDLVALNQNVGLRNLLCTDNYVTVPSVSGSAGASLGASAGSMVDINDSDRAMRLISRMDRTIQVGLGVETLYDLYMGASYLQSVSSSATSSDSGGGDEEHFQSDAVEQVESEYCYPLMKHLGICDFSLCALLGAISVRLLLQVLMLLLTDRSVVLLSSNITLLTKIQSVIPRLIWPFRLNNTHNIVQLQSHAVLERFLTRNDPVDVSPDSVPDRTPHLKQQQEHSHQHASSSNSSTFQRMLGRINSSSGKSMTNVKDALTEEEDGRRRSQTDFTGAASHTPITPPTPPTPSTPKKKREGDDSKSLLMCVNSKVFSAAAPEIKVRLLNLVVKNSVVTCFDLDSCTVVTAHHSTPSSSSLPASSSLASLATGGLLPPSNPYDEDDIDQVLANETHSEAIPQVSRLSNEGLFRCANFDVFRELFAHVTRCIDEYNQDVFAQNMQFNGVDFAQLTKATNSQLERTFYLFWSELVLRALPRNINYYHTSKVLSCDIKCMVAELLSNAKSSMACSEDEFRHGRAGLADSINTELVHFLTADEFKSYFTEQTNSATNCLLHAFYQDLLLDSSPVFLDLLRRHCKVLEYWAF